MRREEDGRGSGIQDSGTDLQNIYICFFIFTHCGNPARVRYRQIGAHTHTHTRTRTPTLLWNVSSLATKNIGSHIPMTWGGGRGHSGTRPTDGTQPGDMRVITEKGTERCRSHTAMPGM